MRRRVILLIAAIGATLAAAPGAQAAAPVCTTPPPATVGYESYLFIYGSDHCSDSDHDALTFAVVTPPEHGTLTGATSEGYFDYLPAEGYSGADSFAFKASDGTDDSNTVSVAITVEPNQPPECPPDFSFDAEPGQDTEFDPAYWYDEDDEPCVDPEWHELDFTVVDTPAHGTLSEYEPYAGFTYRPNPGYSGPDSFTFRATDGTDESELVTANIDVLKPNHAPSCTPLMTLRTEPDRPLVIGPINHLFGCHDPDGDPMWPSLVSGPSHGAFTVDRGTLIYTPKPGFEGTDEVRFQVSDPRGGVSNVATALFVVARPVVAKPSDATAPVVRMRTASRQSLRSLRRRGLRLVITASEACRVSVVVDVSRTTARRLRLTSRRLGATARAVPAGQTTVTVRLRPKARKALRRAARLRLRVTVAATDEAGNTRTRTRQVTVRR
jgi:hypothetical protein